MNESKYTRSWKLQEKKSSRHWCLIPESLPHWKQHLQWQKNLGKLLETGPDSRLSFQLTDSLLVNFRAVALLPWRRRRNLPVHTLPSKAFQLHILCWRAESLRMGTYKQQGILLFSACYQLSKDLDQAATTELRWMLSSRTSAKAADWDSQHSQSEHDKYIFMETIWNSRSPSWVLIRVKSTDLHPTVFMNHGWKNAVMSPVQIDSEGFSSMRIGARDLQWLLVNWIERV